MGTLIRHQSNGCVAIRIGVVCVGENLQRVLVGRNFAHTHIHSMTIAINILMRTAQTHIYQYSLFPLHSDLFLIMFVKTFCVYEI